MERDSKTGNNLTLVDQLVAVGIDTGQDFDDLVRQLAERLGNQEQARRMALRATGSTLEQIGKSFENKGFKGVSREAVRKSIQRGVSKLTE